MNRRSNRDYEERLNSTTERGSEERGDDLRSEIKTEEFEGESKKTRLSSAASDLEGTFHCDICGKGFARYEYVGAHKRYFHSDARPYACDRCGKVFKTTHDRNRHQLTHSVNEMKNKTRLLRGSAASSLRRVALPGFSGNRRRMIDGDRDRPRGGTGTTASDYKAAEDAHLKMQPARLKIQPARLKIQPARRKIQPARRKMQPVVKLERLTLSPSWLSKSDEFPDKNIFETTISIPDTKRDHRHSSQLETDEAAANLHLEVEEINDDDDDVSSPPPSDLRYDSDSQSVDSNDDPYAAEFEEALISFLPQEFSDNGERRPNDETDSGGGSAGEGGGGGGSKKFRCSICREVFKSNASMRAHKATCTETCYVEVEGPAPFRCKRCARRFETLKAVLNHRRTVHAAKRLRCRYCAKAFAFRSALRVHETAHGRRDEEGATENVRNFHFACGLCQKVFRTRDGARKHERYFHSDERPFRCHACNKSFKVARELRRHLECCHAKEEERNVADGGGDEKPFFECKECERRFETSKKLLCHRRTVHAPKSLKCKKCDVAFAFESQLRLHEAAAHVEEDASERSSSFSCDLCGKAFKSEERVKCHKKYFHCDDRPFACDQCGKSFKVAGELRRHMASHSTARGTRGTETTTTTTTLRRPDEKCYDEVDGPLPYRCRACEKPYARLASLHVHFRVHHTPKEFECRHCAKRFALRCELTEHLVAHDAERRLQCDECGRAFKWRQALVRHRRFAHTTERPYACDRCPRAFKSERSLSKHKASKRCRARPDRRRSVATKGDPSSSGQEGHEVSTKHYPFYCNLCGKGMASSGYLTTHLRYIHSDEKPYPCDRCEKAFKSGHDLRRHELTHSTKKKTAARLSEGLSSAERVRADLPNESGASTIENLSLPPPEGASSLTASASTVGEVATPFRCHHCGSRFAKLASVSAHVRVHHAPPEKRRHRCKYCGDDFAAKSELTAHVAASHEGGFSAQCDECGKTFKQKTSLKTHLKFAHTGDEKPHVCPICDKSFIFSSHLKLHMRCHLRKGSDSTDAPSNRTSSSISRRQSRDDDDGGGGPATLPKTKRRAGERSYRCDICHVALASRPLFWSHKSEQHPGEESYATVDGPSPYECKQCGKRFKESRYVYTHIRNCHMKKELKCGRCDKEFALRYQLRMHMVTHDGTRPFRCDVCGDAFKRKYGLISHRIYAHDDRDQLFFCNVCGKPVTSLYGLERHMKSHSADDTTPGTRTDAPPSIRPEENRQGGGRPDPLTCRACGKKFRNLMALYMHFRIHHSRKEFKCAHCDKLFAQRSEWREHQVVHEDGYAYQCNECARPFRWRQALVRHMKYAHSTERPYLCDRCTKSYISHYDLMRHVNSSHLDRRPYVCRFCDKTFKHPSDLKRHRKRHANHETAASEEVEIVPPPSPVRKTRVVGQAFRLAAAVQNTDDDLGLSGENVVYSAGENVAYSAGENVVYLAGENVVYSAGENVVYSAGENVAYSAGENVVYSAGENVVYSAGENVVYSAGENVVYSAGENVVYSDCIEEFPDNAVLFKIVTSETDVSAPPTTAAALAADASYRSDLRPASEQSAAVESILALRTTADAGETFPDRRRVIVVSDRTMNLLRSGQNVVFRRSAEDSERFEVDEEAAPDDRRTTDANDDGSSERQDCDVETLECSVALESRPVVRSSTSPTFPNADRESRVVRSRFIVESPVQIERRGLRSGRPSSPSLALSDVNKRGPTVRTAVRMANRDDSDDYSDCVRNSTATLVADDGTEDAFVLNADLIRTSEFKAVDELEDFEQVESFLDSESIRRSLPDAESLQRDRKTDAVDENLGEDVDAGLEVGVVVKTESFDDAETVTAEKITQHVKKGFKCKYCGKAFALRFQLRRHMTTTHEGEYAFACEVCGKAFAGKPELGRHRSLVHFDRPLSYACHRCGRSFGAISALERHLVFHSKDGDWDRDPTRGKEERYVEVEGLRPFRCTFCPKRFGRSETVSAHVRKDHRKTQTNCRFCGDVFATRDELNEHGLVVHADEFPFRCDEACGKAFRTKRSLSAHVDRFHSDQRPYVCGECGKAFESPYDLRRHLRGHLENSSISAQNVAASSSTSKPVPDRSARPSSSTPIRNPAKRRKIGGRRVSFLETNGSSDDRALRRYGDDDDEKSPCDREYRCDICYAKLESKTTFLSHQNECHPDEKSYVEVDGPSPFKCRLCDVRFKESRYVSTHVRSCHMEKSYACRECGKVFGLRYPLKLHMRKHEPRSSQQCDECGTIFDTKLGLTYHKKKEHAVVDVRPVPTSLDDASRRGDTTSAYACEQCGKLLPSLSGLRTHLRYHMIAKDGPNVVTDDDIVLALQDPRLVCAAEHLAALFPGMLDGGAALRLSLPPSGRSLEDLSMKERNRVLWKALIVRTEGPTPFSCRLCRKTCKSRSSICLHIRFYHMIKEFECDVCGKRFTLQGELIDHAAVHSDLCSFQCDVCGMAFKWKQALNRHMKCSHSTGSPAFCDQCDKSFRCRTVLKIHQRHVHRHDRPYVCHRCSKSYKFSSHLARHKKDCHSAASYKPSARGASKKRKNF